MATYRAVTLHVAGAATIGLLSYVVSEVHALYCSFLWEPDKFKGGPSPASLGSAKTTSQDLLAAFRDMHLESDDAIVVRSLRTVNSFEVSLSGVSDAIDATAEIIDPLRRRERKEKLRHEIVMNRFAEAGASIDNEMKSISLLREKAALLDELVRQNLMTEAARTVALQNMFDMQNNAAEMLDFNVISVEGTADDAVRELTQ